jgi:hypothetical protein
VLAVLREALVILDEDESNKSAETEPDLNRALAVCFLHAIRKRYVDGLPTLESPIFGEARNQPTPATAGSAAERKIPDFQCGYIDHYCADPRFSSRIFVIECKRLGKPTPAGWVFNHHYVDDGIRRFVDTNYRYGNEVGSGAMVGYVDGTPVADVLTEVNGIAESRGIPLLAHESDSQLLTELVHDLERDFPESPFRLAHLWIQRRKPVALPAGS